MYVQCIAESINIMGTQIGKAMKERNPEPIQLMANEEVADGADFLDLNIGPARKEGPKLMPWMVNVTEEITDCHPDNPGIRPGNERTGVHGRDLADMDRRARCIV